MAAKKRCDRCAGSGTVLGMGMMPADCPECEGTGKIVEIKDELAFLEMTDSYKGALSAIQKLDPSISEEEAKKIFKEEFDKNAAKTPKRSKSSKQSNLEA